MCGASSGEVAVGSDQTALMNNITNENNTVFGESQGILSSLNAAFAPILQGGPNQTGFSQAEDTSMNTEATESTAQNFNTAKKELQENQDAEGGGNDFVPSGEQDSENASLDATAAQTQSQAQQQILQANYATGRQNFNTAAGVLGGEAGTLNAVGTADAATSAGSAASSTQNQISANSNSVWSSVLGALGGVAGAATTAFCPAKGSLYLMMDKTWKLVEELQVGDVLRGIGGDPQTIEEIQSALAPVLRVTLDNGLVARNSYTHAYALPRGGFVVARKAKGCTVATECGTGKVLEVLLDGEDIVFNVITDGSHTYCADGVWALGVGDAERRVDMETWARVGNAIEVEV